jgi:hypothetical protein
MSRRLTKEEFIKNSIVKHGHKYDYSLVEYINDRTPVLIICPLHGEFSQIPNVHKRSGCSECGLLKRSNSRRNEVDNLISSFKSKHGDKYDYSNVQYIKMRDKVKIRCKKHDYLFFQTPEKHLHSKTGGCNKCNSIGKGKLSREEFISKSVSVHGVKYSYEKTLYKKSNSKVIIECEKHGFFEMTPNSHLMGHGCRKCAKNHKYTIEDLNSIFIDIYNDNLKFDFSEYKNIKSKIIVNCKNHSYFETTAELLINGYGCSSCGKISLGEERISKYLLSNNIEYTKQKSFDDCLFVNKLQFDFFIPSKNICIEYDGKQHFEPIEYFGGLKSYNDQVKKDNIKNGFCENRNIKLIRIPYYKYDSIDKILEEQL